MGVDDDLDARVVVPPVSTGTADENVFKTVTTRWRTAIRVPQADE